MDDSVPSGSRRRKAAARTPCQEGAPGAGHPARARRRPAPDAAAPRQQPVLERLRAAAARGLGLDAERLPADRPLVALGLDSLGAAELAGAVEAELGVELAVADLLAGPTLAELAALVSRRLPPPAAAPGSAGAAPGGGATTATPAAPDAAASVARPAAAGAAAAVVERFPLSHGQRAIWLLDRMVPGGNPACLVAGAAAVRGELDAGRLRRAIAALIARHAALRTGFEESGGEAVQAVRGAVEWSLAEEDAAGVGDEQLAERLAEEAHRPFDLTRGPLLRVMLFHRRNSPILLLAAHHLVADFWSLGVMLAELGALYRGTALPPATASYAAYAGAQERLLAGPEGERLAAWWRGALASGAPPLELPADRPRPPLPTFRGASRAARLAGGANERLCALGRAAGATPFMTLLAAFLTLLHRWTGQEELLVGTPASGRDRPELAGLVGTLVNPLAVRGDLRGSPTFAELLARVKQAAVAAFAHRRYPFPLVAELAELAGGGRDPSRSPVFQAMFVLYRERRGERGLGDLALREPGATLDLGGLVLESVRLPRRAAQLDLTLMMAEAGGALTAVLEYNRDLLDAATAERMLGQLRALVEALAAPATPGGAEAAAAAAGVAARRVIGELPLLGAAERHQLIREWNDAAAAAPPPGRLAGAAATVHSLFEWQAARRPAAAAVAGQGATLTYGEVETRANRLARYLLRLGVGPEVRVGLCVERSPEMVVALLAILKAGRAYVPLDPGHPAERLRLVLADSAAAVLVTEERWLPRLGIDEDAAAAAGPYVVCLDRERGWIDAEEGTAPAAPGLAESAAYLIYTSGSTGRPKGVVLPHRAVASFLRAMAARPGLGPGDVVPALTTLAFDIAGLEIYLPLAVGGRVEMLSTAAAADGARLAARLAAAGVTAMQATPATWRLLLDSGWEGRPGMLALCGGEALPYQLAAELLARGLRLWNVYGPTETAIWSASRPVAPVAAPGADLPDTAAPAVLLPAGAAAVPLGRPRAGAAV
jgi:non-ribosomal peptide synthetase component F/acyl carrier protein